MSVTTKHGKGLSVVFAAGFLFFLVGAIVARLLPSGWHAAAGVQNQSMIQKATSAAYSCLNFALMG